MTIQHPSWAKIKEQVLLKYKDSTEVEDGGRISYSQYSNYAECPRKWYLGYGLNLRKYENTIHTLFGTAMHETIQTFLWYYLQGQSEKAENLNLKEILLHRMKKELEKSEDKSFTSSTELIEFYNQGCEILQAFLFYRTKYFNPEVYELIAIEAPILEKVFDRKIYFLCFLDIVLYNKIEDCYEIVDIKTSTGGWNMWTRKDSLKQSQLLLYKYFFSEQFKVPLDKIKVYFFIVVRKEDTKKIQIFEPDDNGITIQSAIDNIKSFVYDCFNPDGSYNLEREYRAVPGKNNKHCKFCDFSNRYDLCPLENRT